MMSRQNSRFILVALSIAIVAIWELQCADANPAIVGYDVLGICIRNCAQCKKMYGPWFEGQLCADACLKFKGKIIPDCEDVGSIAPFLNKLE